MRAWVCALVVGLSLGCSSSGSKNDGGGGGHAGGVAGQAGGAAGQAGGAAGQAGGAGGQAGTASTGGRGGGAGAGGTSAGAGGTGAGGAGGQTGGTGGGTGGRGGTAGGTAGAGGQAGSAATGGRDGGSDGGINFCARLSGSQFMSLDQLECGRGPDGGALCRWRINFTNATMFTWQHSDFAETGTYTCDGNTITAQRQTGGPITATYDPASQRLSWDGVLYACASCTSI